MKKLEPQKIALIAGIFMGGWHLLWSLLVMIGIAQLILDFIFWLHFLHNPFTVETFDIGRAALLVVVTGCIGFIGGGIFALLWNKMHGER